MTRRAPIAPVAGPGKGSSRAASLVVLIAAVALVATGCSDLKRFWDRSPTGPAIQRDTVSPTVAILSPSGPDTTHATPVSGDAFAIVIRAEDNVGIARVELHLDDLPAQVITGPPWEPVWNTTSFAEGSCHSLWATAVDLAGNASMSDTVYARTFNAGPSLTLSEPDDGALVLGSITVTASFPGPTATLDHVDFVADATPVGTLTAPPWSLTLDTHTLSPGDHFLSATATTTNGYVGVSAPVRVRVNNETPAVSVDFPESGRRVATRGTLILSGTARDVIEGAIPAERVQWTSSLDGPLGNGRYLRRKLLSVGTHTMTLSATNAWGTSASASIQVEVAATPTYGYCRYVYGMMIRGYCLSCHVPGTTDYPNSLYDMSSYAGFMAGGKTREYEAIAPCRPESSLVWNKLTAEIPWVGDPMPPRDRFLPVPQSILDKLRTWILEGAPPDDPETCPY